MAGMRDVAKLAGVSLSTVSTVLNNNEKYVSGECREKVLGAAEELGYKIPPKKRFSQKTIAVVLPVVTSSFFSNVLNGIESVISQDENLLLFYNSNYNFEKERACIKTLRKQSLAGIVLNSICPLDREPDYLAWLKKEFIDNGIPVVLLERKIQLKEFYCIFIDNFQSAYLATNHLLQQGHRKIAHIAGNDHMLHSFERLEGYRNALEDAKIDFDMDRVERGDFTPYSGYESMKKLLERGTEFTALFSANDQMAIGAMKALKAFGEKIPEDIAVIGFDNLSVSSLVTPALSSIHVPTYQMGMLAAKIVLEASEGKTCKYMNQLSTNLIVRRSSDANATNEWDLTGW